MGAETTNNDHGYTQKEVSLLSLLLFFLYIVSFAEQKDMKSDYNFSKMVGDFVFS